MDSKATLPWNSKGVERSNSTASPSGRSTKSHESVSVLGVHPLGSLRVLGREDSPRAASRQTDNDDNLPPLEPHSGEVVLVERAKDAQFRSNRDPQAHSYGGGDVAIVLDLPEVFTVGYDSISFTAKHFLGVRDIPASPHFFWVAHPSGVSARAGIWLLTSETVDRVHVVQWDKYNEVLTEATRAECRNAAEHISQVHSKLIPYPDPTKVAGAVGQVSDSKAQANLTMWRQLSSNITKASLNRITGHQTGGWIVNTLDRVQGALHMAGEVELEMAMPNKNLQSRELKFSFVQQARTFSLESIGAERSLEATDSTPYLMSLIDNSNNDLADDDLVGELQFCYIVGMHLGNDACIQQWWYMVLKLIIKAYLLPIRKPLLAASILRALTAQLTYGTDWLDGSILDYAETNCRELRLGLTIYKRRLEESLQGPGASSLSPDHVAVGAAFSRLETVLSDQGWDVTGQYLRKGTIMMEDGEQVELEMSELEAEDERGEWAPEVVELDEHGRQRDLVSWSD